MEKQNNLLFELNEAKETKISPLSTSESYETINDFWKSFIAPHLPQKSTVIGWHKILMKYVSEPNAIFAIRAFHTWPNKEHDNTDLRRGFYTIVDNDSYSFFFTDNYFVSYFEKMLQNNYVPSYDCFRETMLEHNFPARFGPSTKEERKKAFYNIVEKNDPGFQKKGYKISHLIDTGTNYWLNNKNYSLKSLLEKYNLHGKYSDWKKDPHYNNQFIRHIKALDTDIELRTILVAHFLRLVHPFNYYLTPGKKHQHFNNIKIPYNDIGEYSHLKNFIINKFTEIYGNEFVEYQKLILAKPTSEDEIKLNLTIKP